MEPRLFSGENRIEVVVGSYDSENQHSSPELLVKIPGVGVFWTPGAYRSGSIIGALGERKDDSHGHLSISDLCELLPIFGLTLDDCLSDDSRVSSEIIRKGCGDVLKWAEYNRRFDPYIYQLEALLRGVSEADFPKIRKLMTETIKELEMLKNGAKVAV